MPKSKKPKASGLESYSSIIRREVTLARDRLGRTRVDELKWLLEFAYADLEKLSDGRLMDLGWEFVAFSFDEDVMPIDYGVSFELEPRARIPLEEIRLFWKMIREGLDAFFAGKGWEMTKPEVFERLKLGQRPFSSEGVKHRQPRRVRYAFDLIKAEWQRLALCNNPKCKRPFVAEKKGRGVFCSPRCSAYVRIQRFRIRKEIDQMPPEERKKLSAKYRELRKSGKPS